MTIAVQNRLGDLLNPPPGDTDPLFYGEGMVCGFEFDQRAQSDPAGVDHCLKLQGLRVTGDAAAEGVTRHGVSS
jgi:hypothetical protein